VIYYVDEEFNRNRSKIRYLGLKGLAVRYLPNAEVAWDAIYEATDIELIIVDVMLAAGSRYGRAETNGFLTTGLSLVADLLQQKTALQPSRILLFSAATRADITSEIQKLVNERGVRYARKTDFDTPQAFASYVQDLVTGGR
jgi:hypothetical protein